jgi:hypothetical protein
VNNYDRCQHTLGKLFVAPPRLEQELLDLIDDARRCRRPSGLVVDALAARRTRADGICEAMYGPAPIRLDSVPGRA